MIHLTIKSAGVYRFPIDFKDIGDQEKEKAVEMVVKASTHAK